MCRIGMSYIRKMNKAIQFLLSPLKTGIRLFKSFLSLLGISKNHNLTILPGIGSKNAHIFVRAGFRTPQQILTASDAELLAIPGVGSSFVKRLRSYRHS